jgi:hypothetical protein
MVKYTLACLLVEFQSLFSDPASLTEKTVRDCFQKIYDRIIKKAAVKYQYKVFGHYQRYLFFFGFLIHITITRFYKPGCRHSDAVLLEFMLPYTRFTADDYVKILLPDLDDDSTEINSDTIRTIRCHFRRYLKDQKITQKIYHSPSEVYHLLLSMFTPGRIRLKLI